MILDVSPATYIALCGLVSDALQTPNDATPILERAAKELGNVTASGMIPSELTEQPQHLENLRQAGYAGR